MSISEWDPMIVMLEWEVCLKIAISSLFKIYPLIGIINVINTFTDANSFYQDRSGLLMG